MKKILIVDDQSDIRRMIRITLGKTFEVLSSHAFTGEAPCKGSVALSHGNLFVRTAKALHCFGKP